MKKIVLIYGIIAGVIVGSMLIITMPLYENGTLNFDNGELVGYTTMVIALSMIFFGVKSYRDNHLAGSISFGNALKVGLLITLVAAVIYALSWEVSYNTMKGDFMGKMTDRHLEKMKTEGVAEEAITVERKKMEEFGEMYKNPFIRFGMTLMEISPVGILISLLSAALLRKKSFLATSQTPNA